MEQHCDVVLVNPNYWSEVFGQNVHLPCGLGYIARSLETNGYTYQIIDLNIQDPREVLEAVERSSPRMLGISMMSYRVEHSYEMLKAVKARFPSIQIVVGGPHVISSKQALFDECSAVDVACIGEGEETILELLRGTPLADVAGIHFRSSLGVRTTVPRDAPKTIDGIPFPTYAGFQLDRYTQSMVLASSRGCPYQCTFCGAPTFLGKKWRKRSADGMLEELRYWFDRGYREFYFEDSLFTADKKRIFDFCDALIAARLPVTIDVHGARADNVHRDLLERMKLAGFRTLTFGVESASDVVLKNFKKGETFAQIERGISLADELGFNIGMFFILGGPGETYEDAQRSFEFAERFKNVEFVYFFKLTPVPGTPYFEYALEKGYVNEAQKYPTGNFGFEDAAFQGNGVMTAEELTRCLKQARRIEKLVRRRFLIRKNLRALGVPSVPQWLVEPAAQLLLQPRLYQAVERTSGRIKALAAQVRPARASVPITIGPSSVV